ncbi:hypothetical protein L345_08091, partial [Ophiophagus hannah]
ASFLGGAREGEKPPPFLREDNRASSSSAAAKGGLRRLHCSRSILDSRGDDCVLRCWFPWKRSTVFPPPSREGSRAGMVVFVPMAPPSSPICSRLASVLLLLCPPGLIQSLKDHITKPTAMAQGRVAHLIEWKGWSAPPVGWGQPPSEEVLYEELTDELKEARFAAGEGREGRLCLTSQLSGPSPGVAEQFAITEATLSGWSSLNEEELSDRGGSQDVIQLQGMTLGLCPRTGPFLLLLSQSPGCVLLLTLLLLLLLLQPDLEGVYLQDGLLFCPPPPAGSLQTFALSNQESPIPSRLLEANDWSRAKGSLGRAEGKLVGPPNGRRWQQSATSLRYVDSSSPSEDEVFYD